MIKTALKFTLMGLLTMGSGAVIACEYKAGETTFTDYANCRYGEDAVQVVALPEGKGWEHCIYHVQAFMPGKLLAVTKERDGKEVLSINERGNIGNPCYLTKRACDAALKENQLALQ